ncbi:hypothetical protein HPB49_014643 [Dermacentor silvarum]|uniref:Uncharacterized protein n=1 Tax=Dermacentor silvarum TaxID=543639 RepID=A0ACB8E1V0_DERSI|nr:hypothetical protein HPB49_014643 [Dermacentor silvarum]
MARASVCSVALGLLLVAGYSVAALDVLTPEKCAGTAVPMHIIPKPPSGHWGIQEPEGHIQWQSEPVSHRSPHHSIERQE